VSLAEALPPAVRVFDPALARRAAACAAEAGRPLLLLCPQGSAAFGGPAWFLALVKDAAAGSGASLLAGIETGDDAGLAYEALRLGLDLVVFGGPEPQAARLAAIAEGLGACLLRHSPPAPDLAAEGNPEALCHALLTDCRQRV